MMIFGFTLWFLLSVAFALALLGLVIWLLSIVYRQTKAEQNKAKRAAPTMDKKKERADTSETLIAEEAVNDESVNTRFFDEEDDIFKNSPFTRENSNLFATQPKNEVTSEFEEESKEGLWSWNGDESEPEPERPSRRQRNIESPRPAIRKQPQRPAEAEPKAPSEPQPQGFFSDAPALFEENRTPRPSQYPSRRSMREQFKNI